MYHVGGSIAGIRRSKTGPSTTFHQGQSCPVKGVMGAVDGTVSACPKSLHPGDATKWGDLLRPANGLVVEPTP